MPPTTMEQKQTRLEHANALIRMIGSCGRRFFWHAGEPGFHEGSSPSGKPVPEGRFSRLELRNGRVYFIDAYSGLATYTHKTPFGNGWRNFHNGGTLRSLVEDMRDYVMKGTPVPEWKIVIKSLGAQGFEKNVWGYGKEDAERLRKESLELPIVERRQG